MRYTAGLVVKQRIEVKPGESRCPGCLSKDLAPSMPRGFIDALMRGLRRVPKHCRACGKRFYARERKAAKPAGTAE